MTPTLIGIESRAGAEGGKTYKGVAVPAASCLYWIDNGDNQEGKMQKKDPELRDFDLVAGACLRQLDFLKPGTLVSVILSRPTRDGRLCSMHQLKDGETSHSIIGSGEEGR